VQTLARNSWSLELCSALTNSICARASASTAPASFPD
jgi:hypothetical protein